MEKLFEPGRPPGNRTGARCERPFRREGWSDLTIIMCLIITSSSTQSRRLCRTHTYLAQQERKLLRAHYIHTASRNGRLNGEMHPRPCNISQGIIMCQFDMFPVSKASFI